jgi:hypothetical protein
MQSGPSVAPRISQANGLCPRRPMTIAAATAIAAQTAAIRSSLCVASIPPYSVNLERGGRGVRPPSEGSVDLRPHGVAATLVSLPCSRGCSAAGPPDSSRGYDEHLSGKGDRMAHFVHRSRPTIWIRLRGDLRRDAEELGGRLSRWSSLDSSTAIAHGPRQAPVQSGSYDDPTNT